MQNTQKQILALKNNDKKVKDLKTAKNEENDNNPTDYLKEQDIILSKPVMIKNINKKLGTSSN